MNRVHVKLTFIDSLLGSEPASKELHQDYVQSLIPEDLYEPEELKAIKEEELQALKDGDEKGRTVFYRNEDGHPCLHNNHIKGFFKAACKALRDDKSTLSSKITAYKSEIDNKIFVFPDADRPESRMIEIQNYGEVTTCQRPLRGQTAQGERIAIADSDMIGPGAYIEFDVLWLQHDKKPIGEALIREWLDYGILKGLGQWRNSGKGSFTYMII